MAILVMCPNPACGELFDVPNDSAGAEVRCPACGTAAMISPAAPPRPLPEAPGPPAAPSPPAAPAGGLAATPGPVVLDLGEGPALPSARPSSAPPAAGTPALSPPAPVPPATSGREGPAKPTAPSRAAAPGAASLRDELEDLFVPREPAVATSQRTDAASGGAARPAAKPTAPGGGAAAPPKQDLLAEFWQGPALSDETQVMASEEGQQDSEGAEVADRRPVAGVVLVLGLVGMAAGLAGGLWAFPAYPLLSAYVGAGLGWVAGFTFGALLILGAEPPEGQVRCPSCGRVSPAGADSCWKCGQPIAGPAPDPLTAECLCAGSYALSNPGGVMGPVMLAVAGHLVISISLELMRAFPQPLSEWRPAIIALCVLAGFVVFSYWTDYFLSVVWQTIAGPARNSKAPSSPRLGSFSTLAAGARGLAVLVVYVVPLLTVPLLPLAVLLLGWPAGKAAMNPAVPARAAWRNAKGFVVLWLFLLMWLAGMALAGVVVMILYGLREALPPMEGVTRSILSVTLSAFAVAALASVAGIFGVAMARCIGALGRYRPDLFPFPPGGGRAGP